MKVHVLQHVKFEKLGSIESWLSARNAEISYTRLHESATLPKPCNADFLIALGGPMSVNDEASLPWLKEEKQFIREAIHAGLPVLGICLGAQLIASALGATVRPNAHPEIGWFDIESTVTGTAAIAPDLFRFPATLSVFHWHGETFDIPPGATRLARSAACENQAFQLGPRVLGLQFHLETTPESAAAMLTKCRHELTEATYIQSEAILRAMPVSAYERGNQLMDQVLAYLTRAL